MYFHYFWKHLCSTEFLCKTFAHYPIGDYFPITIVFYSLHSLQSQMLSFIFNKWWNTNSWSPQPGQERRLKQSLVMECMLHSLCLFVFLDNTLYQASAVRKLKELPNPCKMTHEPLLCYYCWSGRSYWNSLMSVHLMLALHSFCFT